MKVAFGKLSLNNRLGFLFQTLDTASAHRTFVQESHLTEPFIHRLPTILMKVCKVEQRRVKKPCLHSMNVYSGRAKGLSSIGYESGIEYYRSEIGAVLSCSRVTSNDIDSCLYVESCVQLFGGGRRVM